MEDNGAAFADESVELDSILQTVRLATGELDESGFAAWLRSLPRH
jgi:hypothetical protein